MADNEITDGGRLFASSAGVFVGENPGNTIEHNHIFNMPWVGISVGSLQTFEPSQADVLQLRPAAVGSLKRA